MAASQANAQPQQLQEQLVQSSQLVIGQDRLLWEAQREENRQRWEKDRQQREENRQQREEDSKQWEEQMRKIRQRWEEDRERNRVWWEENWKQLRERERQLQQREELMNNDDLDDLDLGHLARTFSGYVSCWFSCPTHEKMD